MRRRRWQIGRWGTNSVMVGPALVLYSALVILPAISAVVYSFTNWDGLSPDFQFVGWANYARLVTDGEGVHAMIVSAVIAVLGTLLVNVIAVPLAVLMNRPGRIFSIYRTAVFYPYVLSAIITGFLFNAIVSPDGAINAILKAIGLKPAPFLLDPVWALGTVIVVLIWSGTGLALVLYLSGLQAIPAELYESAELDGASAWKRFRYITWPMLSSVVTINIVLSMAGLLRTYDIVLSLTNGGPAGQTQTIAYRILAIAYQNQGIGSASAGAVVLLLVTTIFSVVVVLLRRRNEVNA